MKHVVGAMMLALALPASGDDLTKGLEALKAGDLVVAAASVEQAVAANPSDRDALYTLGVIRWQDAYNALGAARKAGTLDAERDRLKKTVTLGHDALRKASAVDPNLWASLLYESLLCRLDAELATDPAEARTHLAKADEILAKAKQVKASGVSSTTPRVGVPMPPPPPSPKKAQAPPPPPPPPAR
jgi:alkyl sulfatase BDS1-like metallo-beta-lactamase superfamily hydrolase